MRKACFRTTLIAALVLLAACANAQTPRNPALDPALVEQVKQAVIKALRESGDLERAVDEGVERYVERQRAAAAERERRAAEASAKALRPVSAARDHIRGDPHAPVSIVEYTDFECPFCKRFHETMQRVVEQSHGQVNWVIRHFPLEQLHSKAPREAVASECATELGGEPAFWKFADEFFALTPSNDRTNLESVLPKIAADLGLDQKKFASCVASERTLQRVEEDYHNAVATGGQGTPWSIVVSRSGKTYPLSGAQPYDAVRELVDLALRDQ